MTGVVSTAVMGQELPAHAAEGTALGSRRADLGQQSSGRDVNVPQGDIFRSCSAFEVGFQRVAS